MARLELLPPGLKPRGSTSMTMCDAPDAEGGWWVLYEPELHRAEPFVIQVGDPSSKDLAKQETWGRRGNGKPIGVAEISKKLTQKKGAVAMAHADVARSALGHTQARHFAAGLDQRFAQRPFARIHKTAVSAAKRVRISMTRSIAASRVALRLARTMPCLLSPMPAAWLTIGHKAA